MFHRHRWVEHARTSATPPRQRLEAEWVSDHCAQAMIFGQTTFVFRCADETCGALKKIECYGSIVPNGTTPAAPAKEDPHA